MELTSFFFLFAPRPTECWQPRSFIALSHPTEETNKLPLDQVVGSSRGPLIERRFVRRTPPTLLNLEDKDFTKRRSRRAKQLAFLAAQLTAPRSPLLSQIEVARSGAILPSFF